MYYHRVVVNFRKTASSPYFLHILVNIPQDGTDLAVYPRNFSGVYMIAYGIVRTASDVDPDKVYDYHTAFDIKPTEVEYNVDINANQKTIRNIKLDRHSDNSAATVGMVKELFPFTKNALYRKYFEEFYDFADADRYRINIGSFGVIFNSLNPKYSQNHYSHEVISTKSERKPLKSTICFLLTRQVYSQKGLLCRSTHEVLTKIAARLLDVRRRLPVLFSPVYLKRRISANIAL